MPDPKKPGLPTGWMLPGSAGARRAGTGGAGWAATCAVGGGGEGGVSENAATALLRAPSDASAARVVGTVSTATPTRAARHVMMTTRGRTGGNYSSIVRANS